MFSKSFKKKTSAFLVASFMMIGSTFCFAKIPDYEMNYGDIPIGASFDYVQEIYGQPKKTIEMNDPLYKQTTYRHYYGNGLFFDVNNDYVIRMCIFTDNNFKSPSGIGVGSSLSEMKQAYGTQDGTSQNTRSWVTNDTYKTYLYDSENNNGKTVKFLFKLNQKLGRVEVKEVQVGFFD